MGGGSKDTQTTTVDVPDYIREAHERLIGQGQQLGQAPFEALPFSPVAPLNPFHTMGLASLAQTGMGFPYMDTAYQQFGQTLGGDYLFGDPTAMGETLAQNPWATGQPMTYTDPTAMGEMVGQNPYLEGMFQAASDPVVERYQQAIAPSRTSRAVLERSLGGTGTAEQQAFDEYNLGRTLADMSSDIYGRAYAQERGLMEQARGREQAARMGAYGQERGFQETARQAERGRMMQSLGLAPMMQGLGLRGAQALLGGGDVLRGPEQAELDFMRGQFEQARGWPFQQQSHLGGLIMPSLGTGGRTTTVDQGKGSPISSILGGGLSALGLFGLPSFGPSLGQAGPSTYYGMDPYAIGRGGY